MPESSCRSGTVARAAAQRCSSSASLSAKQQHVGVHRHAGVTLDVAVDLESLDHHVEIVGADQRPGGEERRLERGRTGRARPSSRTRSRRIQRDASDTVSMNSGCE